MIESPLLQELLEQRTKQTRCADLVRFLSACFGSLPETLVASLKSVDSDQVFDSLVDAAAVCPDLMSFQQRLQSIG